MVPVNLGKLRLEQSRSGLVTTSGFLAVPQPNQQGPVELEWRLSETLCGDDPEASSRRTAPASTANLKRSF